MEAGRIILEKFAFTLLFELEKERGKTHRWMQIEKSKKVEDVGLMEDKLEQMGREKADLSLRYSIMREKI